MLPAIGLYAMFSLFHSVVSFFGAWFAPGVVALLSWLLFRAN